MWLGKLPSGSDTARTVTSLFNKRRSDRCFGLFGKTCSIDMQARNLAAILWQQGVPSRLKFKYHNAKAIELSHSVDMQAGIETGNRELDRAPRMLAELNRAPARTRINFLLLCLFLGTMLFFGGASRADVMSLPIVRLASVVMIAIALMQIDHQQWMVIRVPALFLLAVGAIVAIQLVPLPPQLWASFPGRALYMDALRTAGIDGGWRPLSLTPDLTLNALLALLPPLATVLALGLIGRIWQQLLIPLLLTVIGLNALVGLLQIASNTPYFYDITNQDAAVGFFSNRNHFAMLMAIGFPALACWAALPQGDPTRRRTRSWLALCAAAALFPLLMTAGSRAGLMLGAIGAIAAFGIRMRRRSHATASNKGPWRPQLVMLIPLAVGAIAIVATVALSRDVALSRILEGTGADQRTANLPIYLTMAKDFFPVGAGFGSFESVFRIYEPAQSVTQEYLNEAHNDLLQIIIEGGVSSAVLLALFLFWFIVRSWNLWWYKVRSPVELLGRTGSVMAALILLGSLVDYPLRTPWLSSLMAVACYWMLPGRSSGAEGSEAERGLAVLEA